MVSQVVQQLIVVQLMHLLVPFLHRDTLHLLLQILYEGLVGSQLVVVKHSQVVVSLSTFVPFSSHFKVKVGQHIPTLTCIHAPSITSQVTLG
jgi:hypothetical protein